MERRRLIESGISVLTIGIAGCSSQGSDPDGTETPSSVAHIEQADRAIEQAGQTLQSESDKFQSKTLENDGVDVRTAAITDYLDTADARLDKAESVGAQEYEGEITLRRGYITFLRDTTKFMDIFAEGYTFAMNAFSYMENSRFSDSIDELEDANAKFSEAEEAFAVAKNSLAQIDWEQVDDLERVGATKIRDAFEELEQILPVLNNMTDGLINYAQGTANLQSGQKELEAENYGGAESEFEKASDEYDSALTVFKRQEQEAPDNLKGTFIDLVCLSEALRDASSHFADGSRALQQGDDQQADEDFQEAQDALDRCGSVE